jgi:hypothetical protein
MSAITRRRYCRTVRHLTNGKIFLCNAVCTVTLLFFPTLTFITPINTAISGITDCHLKKIRRLKRTAFRSVSSMTAVVNTWSITRRNNSMRSAVNKCVVIFITIRDRRWQNSRPARPVARLPRWLSLTVAVSHCRLRRPMRVAGGRPCWCSNRRCRPLGCQ